MHSMNQDDICGVESTATRGCCCLELWLTPGRAPPSLVNVEGGTLANANKLQPAWANAHRLTQECAQSRIHRPTRRWRVDRGKKSPRRGSEPRLFLREAREQHGLLCAITQPITKPYHT